MSGSVLVQSYLTKNSRVLVPLSSRPIYRLKSYSNTVLVPKTTFPQRIGFAKRCERDREIEKAACFADHYNWQRENNNGTEFIFHDGPPYANGDTHLGHAVNKILKDITTRYKSLSGHQVHYVPGWDCHGLPIEVKAISSTDNTSPIEVRQRARRFAAETITKQMTSFRNWGVMADWTKPYQTYDPSYVTQQLQAFFSLYEKGYIFQDYKPVYWSPSNRTALAEAELEYDKSHESWSVFVAFQLSSIPDTISSNLPKDARAGVLVWTTTPWTLPANQAVCYSPKHEYCVVQSETSGRCFLVACDVVDNMQHHLKQGLRVLKKFPGAVLKDVTYHHPLHPEREQRLIEGDHVTMEKGTGLVHSAPNHGLEDYQNALKHNMPLDECLVDENGCFTARAGKELSGHDVLGSGSFVVMKLLEDRIEHVGKYTHSYPYDWRSKKPIIIRSSRQWFINLDKLRTRAVECLEGVKITPETARSMFVNQLKQRPHWCISRQRYWGVPIPVLFRDSTALTSRKFVDHVCNLILQEGSDVWWTAPMDKVVTPEIRNDLKLGPDEKIEKGSDIMDIWLDSGLSWKMVLPESKQADIYLEGGDQIRGWFQSSLITSVALQNQAPYKHIFLHGFTLDSEGRKMSKSLGNVIDPHTVMNGGRDPKLEPAYGIDVLRWWVASHASDNENVTVAQHIFSECHTSVSKLRNTLRFCLGALQDFSREMHLCCYEDLLPLDQFMLHLLYNFHLKVTSQYEALQYNHVCSQMLNFVVNEASSLYFQAVKDRLYCDASNSLTRRSCQTVLSHTLDVLARLTAPVLPHLCEEVFLHHPERKCAQAGVFRQKWPPLPNEWDQKHFEELREPLWKVRDAVNKVTSSSNSKQHDIIISARENAQQYNLLHKLQVEDVATHSGLTDILQVASARFTTSPKAPPAISNTGNDTVLLDEGTGLQVQVLPTTFALCDRCRRHISHAVGQLCKRCDEALEEHRLSLHAC